MNSQGVNTHNIWLKILYIWSLFALTPLCLAEQDSNFISDVVDVEERMLYAKFWQSKVIDGDTVILPISEIKENNQQLFITNHTMTDLASYPRALSNKDITNKILKISSPYSSELYYADGKKVIALDYESYRHSINLDVLIDSNEQLKNIQMGMVVRRTNMRRFPDSKSAFKTTTSTNLDRFQETALFPTDTVAILHESLDKKWFFAIAYNYAAWVKKEDIAIGDRKQIVDYKNTDNFLVVTGSKIHTSSNPYNANLSELQLEMGTVIPLVAQENIPTTIGRQNTYASYVISLPVRDDKGALVFQSALIARSEDVNKGFLSYTKNNIITQAFKFLGERYGWGHSFNARDCTGFVGEVYKTFGILMPRNSGDQSQSELGENSHFLSTASTKEKLSFFEELDVGELIYRPGHVMMFLGSHENKPFIIHDVSELKYFKENGDYYKSILNGVSITPLLPLQLTENKSYVDKIYNVKKIK